MLRPELADDNHVLTVYLYGKGSQEVHGRTGSYVVPSSAANNPDVIDLLVVPPPHVNRMFPEGDISCAGIRMSLVGRLVLLTEHGLDVSSLVEGESNQSGKHRGRLRFIPVPVGSFASEDSLQKSVSAGATARPSVASKSPLAAASTAVLSPVAAAFGISVHVESLGSPQLLSPVPGLQPGLYRLNCGAARAGSRRPASWTRKRFRIVSSWFSCSRTVEISRVLVPKINLFKKGPRPTGIGICRPNSGPNFSGHFS